MDVLVISIKYFFIALCGFYSFCKMQNMKISAQKRCFLLLGAIITSLLYMIVKQLVYELYILALVVPFLLLVKLLLKLSFKTVIPIGLIAISFSFVVAVISVFFASFILFVSQKIFNFNATYIVNLIQNILTGVFQIIIVFLFFKIKRFRKGIPNLEKYVDSDLCIYISIAIILLMSFGEIKNKENVLIIFIAFLIAFFGIVLFFIWKSHLRKTYIQRQFNKEIDELNKNIDKLQLKNTEIEAENQALAKVIHRDNKVISSFINTLTIVAKETTDKIAQERLMEFINYLHKENADRKQYFITSQTTNNQILKTDVFAVDSILGLMRNKAIENGIEFKVYVDCSVQELIENSINEIDLITILADLIENAIIATKYSGEKIIEVKFYIKNCNYAVKVCDTGIPFESIVLEHFGSKKITTHINDGGSGIGLVTICELLRKYRASFFLNQGCGEKLKTIEIIFDQNSNFKIVSNV
ncbi:MAG: sensor histidine kinase [Clostridia bacterium]|nr:sensor histidine kinase [Clostridia bacterium]